MTSLAVFRILRAKKHILLRLILTLAILWAMASTRRSGGRHEELSRETKTVVVLESVEGQLRDELANSTHQSLEEEEATDGKLYHTVRGFECRERVFCQSKSKISPV